MSGKKIFMKNRHLPNWIIWLTEHLPQAILDDVVVIDLVWNLLKEGIDVTFHFDLDHHKCIWKGVSHKR